MKLVLTILSLVAISFTVFATGDEAMPKSAAAKSALCLIEEYFRQNDVLTTQLAHIERQLVEATSREEQIELRLQYSSAEIAWSSLITASLNHWIINDFYLNKRSQL
ncbi:MAG: hypothetical protein AABY64_04675 [Bdellovibrionota bacterium]